jgi:cytochrome c oxidase subunit 4
MISAHVTTPKLVVSWLALLGLTFLSFGISRVGLGEAELFIALGISFVKTFVVLFIFMHLVEQRFANRLIVILTFLFIALLVTLTVADPLTRKTFPQRPDPAASPYP